MKYPDFANTRSISRAGITQTGQIWALAKQVQVEVAHCSSPATSIQSRAALRIGLMMPLAEKWLATGSSVAALTI
jgi:hypothetical protein